MTSQVYKLEDAKVKKTCQRRDPMHAFTSYDLRRRRCGYICLDKLQSSASCEVGVSIHSKLISAQGSQVR
jgi:hypothetical protein